VGLVGVQAVEGEKSTVAEKRTPIRPFVQSVG
jgi:hypothetical protein